MIFFHVFEKGGFVRETLLFLAHCAAVADLAFLLMIVIAIKVTGTLEEVGARLVFVHLVLLNEFIE